MELSNIKLIVSDSQMQGNNASMNIIESLNTFKLYNNIDLIIIARGGGSFEDLMCFNDEKLIRNIFHVNIPIISAIGHETDFTLCDFVSDLRASTPSEAAEIASPDINESLMHLENSISLINNNILKRIDIEKNRFNKILQLLYINPIERYKEKNNYIQLLKKIINNKIFDKILQNKIYIKSKYEMLRSFDPNVIKKKGYSIVRKNNKIIINSNNIKKNDEICIDFFKGEIKTVIKNIR